MDEFLAQLRGQIARNIASYGCHVMGVFADADDGTPPFSYTVGNAQRGLPELLVIGLIDNGVLNMLSDLMVERGGKFDDGELVSLGGPCPVCIIEASDKVQDQYTLQAKHWAPNGYAVMQIVLPDKHGRFPWDAGCEAPYCNMPVYRRMVN